MISYDLKKVRLVLLLIPISFVAGIAITEFLAFLSLLILLFLNKNKSVFFDSKIIFLYIFSIYIFFNAYFQIFDDLKLSSFFHIRFVFFSISIFFLCEVFESNKEKNFFLYFILFLFILTFDSIFQFFNGSNFFGFEIIKGRVSSFFQEELILGSFLVRLIPIILWFIFFLKIDLIKNFFYSVVFFSFYLISIYISGERTSFFLCMILLLSLFIIIKKLRTIITYSSLILLIFAFTCSYFKIGSTDVASRMFIKTFNQITDNKLIKQKNNIGTNENFTQNLKLYSTDHEGHIKLAFKLFNESKIFGAGPKGFRYYCRTVNYDSDVGICSTHPHNITIQIITELGLIGLMFYIFAGCFVLYNFFKLLINKKYTDQYLSFYAITLGLIINLFPLIPGGNFFNNWISLFLYYNIGFYLYSYKKCILK